MTCYICSGRTDVKMLLQAKVPVCGSCKRTHGLIERDPAPTITLGRVGLTSSDAPWAFVYPTSITVSAT